MSITIEALIGNRENVIVLYASIESIARERDRLAKWRADELTVIPDRARLVSEQMGCDAQRVSTPAIDLLAARARAADLLKQYGAPVPPLAIELLDRVRVEARYIERMAELERLERRSAEARFTQPPRTPSRGMN